MRRLFFMHYKRVSLLSYGRVIDAVPGNLSLVSSSRTLMYCMYTMATNATIDKQIMCANYFNITAEEAKHYIKIGFQCIHPWWSVRNQKSTEI